MALKNLQGYQWRRDRLGYRPEVARSNWAKGRLLQDQGRLIEAQAYLEKASVLYMEMRPSGQGKYIILKEVDFDSQVVFWSR